LKKEKLKKTKMINITIDCATGAEARVQLMALLGATDGPFEQIAIKD
jgi:hypothetical protein